MAPPVAAFLDDMGRAGHEWGQRDCLMWLGIWTLQQVGVDGCAEWRGRYKTYLGAVRLLNRLGGMEACAARGAALAGLVETTDPLPGAIGVVDFLTPRGVQPTGSIFTGRRWAALMVGGGVVSKRAEPRRAWNLP